LSKDIDGIQKERITKQLLDAMQVESAKRKMSLGFLQVCEDEALLVKLLNQRGFHRTLDLPLAYSDISWYSFKMRLLYKYVYQVCPFPFTRMCVAYNGDVIICCQDWLRAGVLGNMASVSLEKIWNSPFFDILRGKMIQKQYAEIITCKNCTNAILST
jgi:hypothetical protein